ncbi:MAG: hypothetical protein IPI67_10855 [Myxococcales bacterium]|nr:hypothetical protein [Myxococcales bacterium]
MKHTTLSVLGGSVVVALVAAACGSGSGGGGTAGSGTGAVSGTGATSGSGGGGTSATGGTSGAGGASGAGGTSTGPCTEGAAQCVGNTPQTCESGAWKSGSPCPFACLAGTCSGSCAPGATQCSGFTPQTCDASGNWIDGTACQFACAAGACTGVCTPGETKCKLTTPQTCDANGAWQNGTACPYGCDKGVCKDACVAGEFNCNGNEVQQCDVGPPAKWVPKSPALNCSPTANTACDKATGTCKAVPTVGTATSTGTYYQYATFNTAAGFLGGYDVDSYEDKIYVNRSSYLDVYQVTLLDTDGDGKLEPDQHPSNPLATGPKEQRTLKLLKSYLKTTDNVPLGGGSVAELFALSDRIYSLGPTHNGEISEYILGTKATKQVVAPTTGLYFSQLGFGDADGLWYASNEGNRRVYSYHAATKQWVAEFNYPNLVGGHMDGLEVIVSPKTGEQYVFVSDMTSDFLGQYRKDPTGWTQVNLFVYTDTTSQVLEGMGFGALNHFWATGGSILYEIGGGDLAQYLE